MIPVSCNLCFKREWKLQLKKYKLSLSKSCFLAFYAKIREDFKQK